jgi:hypothetical protein
MRPPSSLPSREYLHECFYYRRGKLFWKWRPLHHFNEDRYRKIFNKKYVGSEAGVTKDHGKSGYRHIINIDYISYKRYRIIFVMFNGNFSEEIDHINGDPLDDRIENLRESTRGQNSMNSSLQERRIGEFKGVSLIKKNNKYKARLKLYGKEIHIGCFHSKEDAHKAYCEAARKYFGEFAREK